MRYLAKLTTGGLAFGIFILAAAAAPFNPAPQKRALIIAISQYGPNTGWDRIHSENDIPLVREAARQMGVPDENVRELRDAEADFQGMLAALAELKESARAGDFVFFHFSGHGQQVADLDGDEEDGYDEALVPYDSPMRFSNAYRGERLLTDDMLYAWIKEMRALLGPEGRLFITLDACHSGTATRGGGSRRGTVERMEPANYQPNKGRLIERKWEYLPKSLLGWSPLVVFSASQGNQFNWEYTPPDGKTCGPLSYALHTGLQNPGDCGDFEALFQRIREEMRHIAPYQQPMAEGDLETVVN
jgi:metacaspase-1